MGELKKHFVDLFNIPAVFTNLYRHRGLILTLTRRDFSARFRGSFGGVLWSFFQPLVMMIIYTVVFSGFFNLRFGKSASPFSFAVYLLCGLLPWTAFADTFSAATSLIHSNANLVKRVVFPLEILPLTLVLVSTIQQLIGFGLLLPLAFLVNQQLSWSLLTLPMILIPQLLLFCGLNWIWASLAVYIPDIRQLTSLLLSAVMLLTPIYYPEDIVPEWASPIVHLNPFASLASMYRQAIMQGVFPDYTQYLVLTLVSFGVCMLGYFWFVKTKNGFADVL